MWGPNADLHMNTQRRELYSSANGDAWYLCRDASGRVFISHEPNIPSGGSPSQIEIGTFLARGAQGPEHQALLQLIATLVEPKVPEGRSVRTA